MTFSACANELQFSAILRKGAAVKHGTAKKQRTLRTVRDDVYGIDIALPRQRGGDLLHAVLYGIEQHHLRLGWETPASRAVNVRHSGVNEYEGRIIISICFINNLLTFAHAYPHHTPVGLKDDEVARREIRRINAQQRNTIAPAQVDDSVAARIDTCASGLARRW